MTVWVLNFTPGTVGSSRVTYGSALLTDKVKGWERTVHQMREKATHLFQGFCLGSYGNLSIPLRAARPTTKSAWSFSLGSSPLPTDSHLHRSVLGRLRASRTFTVSCQKTESLSSCKDTPSPCVHQQSLKPGDAALSRSLTPLINLIRGDAARMPDQIAFVYHLSLVF